MTITLTTFQDLIEHLNDVQFGGTADQQMRVIKRAVRNGYAQLMEQHDWRYFRREYMLPLSEPVLGATGDTLVYDHTGGAAERLVTLTGTTFPSWLISYPRHGRLEIQGEVYEVERYLSTTTCTLSSIQNPGADVSSTTDWSIYRNTYPLPDDFGGIDEIHNKDNPYGQFYIQPDDWMTHERSFNQSGEPFGWTIMADPARLGGFALRVVGYPTDDDKLTFIYRSRGSETIISGLETKATAGTVELTSGDETVTGSSTTFDSTMNGCIFRVSSSATAPTGPDGSNPYSQQHQIRSVTSATALELWTAATANLTAGKAYVISSLVDVEPGAMLLALQRACEYEMAVLLQEDAKIEMRWQRFVRAVQLAKGHDEKLLIRRVSGSEYYPPVDSKGGILGNPDDYVGGETVSVP